MNILHIATHLGGGVGTVLINWAATDKKNKHIFMCLGYNYDRAIHKCRDLDLELSSNVTHKQILDKIEESDLVVIHYWNHPLLVSFLISEELPPSRIIVYSHIAGHSVPYVIPENLYEYADTVVHSSRNAKGADDSNTVMSSGGIERFLDVKRFPDDFFNILYIGTLDYSKISKDFVKICKKISDKVDNARFLVCGTGSSEKDIKESINRLGISDKFSFFGYVPDIKKYLELSDVFLYPLSNTHYGTGEQVIGEAMAAGVVPIVYNNPCEAYIVENNKSGLVVSSIDEAVDATVLLKDNKELTNRLSTEARTRAKEMYSADVFTSKWDNIFKNIIKTDKKKRVWNKVVKNPSGATVLIESLGSSGRVISDYIESKRKLEELFLGSDQWKSINKGSVYQYLLHFPEDKNLRDFRKIVEGE